MLSMDPVNLIQQAIDSSIAHLKNCITDRDDMLHDPRGGNLEIFNTIGIQMLNEISETRSSLNDITESIDTVRKNPQDFNITEATLQTRELYVKRNLELINQFEIKTKKQDNERTEMYRKQNEPNSTLYNSKSNGINNLNGNYKSQQLDTNSQIDFLHDSTAQTRHLADMIHSTLQEDELILNQISDNVDSVQNKMEEATKKIKKLIEEEGKTPTYLVAVLSIVFIVLLFILI